MKCFKLHLKPNLPWWLVAIMQCNETSLGSVWGVCCLRRIWGWWWCWWWCYSLPPEGDRWSAHIYKPSFSACHSNSSFPIHNQNNRDVVVEMRVWPNLTNYSYSTLWLGSQLFLEASFHQKKKQKLYMIKNNCTHGKYIFWFTKSKLGLWDSKLKLTF